MGMVYRATQLSLKRPVALKVLAFELGNDPGFRARFEREGEVQAALDHDHIVSIYEAGQTEYGMFIAMRLIQGPTLKDLIFSGELDPRRTLRLLAQVAHALDAAHEADLIHRDVKPQNILIGQGDHAYLADFGLIKAVDDHGPLTGTGQFIGTIDYVAPEQIQGDPATATSDCYALDRGPVRVPDRPGSVPATERGRDAPCPRAPAPAEADRGPAGPAAELDDVIAHGMAKDPTARPATAVELIMEAQRALGSWSPHKDSQVHQAPGAVSPDRDQATRVRARPPR